MPKKKKERLTPKQAKFVKEYVGGDKTIPQALLGAGYNITSKESGEVLGNRMLRQPKIQNEMKAELDRLYPDSRATRFDVLHGIMQDPQARPSDRMKAVEIINKMVGDNAATRHERAEARVTLPTLPGVKE